ncbi:helix-turn-helix transcriptional regulator (plasmid) [Nocardia sp. NBC_01377]|uniref:helix-turn-helix domain-containing protein n=1 Tax=Nocardia sp. NBC_01377 TaxID=2903595 RepID=UPI002F90BE8D
MGHATPNAAMPGGHNDDDNSCADIGHVFAEHRVKQKRSRLSVARAIGCSPGHYEKMELGSRRFTLEYLEGAAKELGIFPLARDQLMALATQPETVLARILAGERTVPQPYDLSLLDVITGPACLYTPATFNILASNEEFDRTFPGACEMGNLVLWLLTSDSAKEVLPQPYWEQEATLYVGAAACLWPGLLTRRAFEQFRDEMAVAKDFNRLWNTYIPPDQVPTTNIVTLDQEGGTTREWFRHAVAPEFAYQRPWRMCVLAPTTRPKSTFIVPTGMARRTRSRP